VTRGVWVVRVVWVPGWFRIREAPQRERPRQRARPLREARARRRSAGSAPRRTRRAVVANRPAWVRHDGCENSLWALSLVGGPVSAPAKPRSGCMAVLCCSRRATATDRLTDGKQDRRGPGLLPRAPGYVRHAPGIDGSARSAILLGGRVAIDIPGIRLVACSFERSRPRMGCLGRAGSEPLSRQRILPPQTHPDLAHAGSVPGLRVSVSTSRVYQVAGLDDVRVVLTASAIVATPQLLFPSLPRYDHRSCASLPGQA
jgi:hypothetical protein